MWAHGVGVIIVVLMLTFIGIWIWAWLPFHRRDFDRLARLPMHDNEPRAALDDGE
jgi:cytochrome c oxidase cbb3-type subunit 4